jgi:cytochrome c556
MPRQSAWLALGAAVLCGAALMASEKAPDTYVRNMKDTNAANNSIRKAVEAKDYDTVAKEAATLKTLFSSTEEFWAKRNTEDAVTSAKAAGKAAGDLETAAKAKNAEGVADAAKAVNAQCKTCHDAHRERLPDGTSEIK